MLVADSPCILELGLVSYLVRGDQATPIYIDSRLLIGGNEHLLGTYLKLHSQMGTFMHYLSYSAQQSFEIR